MKKIILSLFATLLFFSCNKEIKDKSIRDKEFNYEESNTSIKYKASLDENVLLFEFIVNELINEKFIIDLNKSNYPQNIADIITSKRSKLINEVSRKDIINLEKIMSNMIEAKINEIKPSEIPNMEVQGLFICKSLINSTSRLLRKTNTSNLKLSSIDNYNTVHEGFIRGMNSFVLNEDFNINVQEYINEIEADTIFAKSKGFLFVHSILVNSIETDISMAQLLDRIDNYTQNNPGEFEIEPVDGETEPSYWPNGSDHGCCGNYSGPCYYWHPVCWIHDKMCTDCTPSWFCLSGCQVD